MKAILASLLVAGFVVAAGPAQAWYCRADSNTGAWGWATRAYRGAAIREALYQCAIRTPRWARCRISYCRP